MKGCAVLLLDRGHEFLQAPGIEDIFHARAFAVGAIALGDEDTHHRHRRGKAFFRLQQDAGVAGEIVVAGDAAERHAEINAFRHRCARRHFHRGEADIVGVFEHRHRAAAIERDVEFARQAVKLAVIEDVVMQLARQRPRIDQLLRIDAGGRAAGDVADIVGAGAARGEAELLQPFEHLDDALRLDLAELEIGARRDIGIAAGPALGERGNAGHLMRLQHAVGDAQPAHERILRRRDIEEAEEFVAEDVDAFGEAARGGFGAQLVPHIERMRFALRLFLRHELLAGGDEAILRHAVDVAFGGDSRDPGRGWGRRWRRAATARGDAAQKSVEILFLFVAEV